MSGPRIIVGGTTVRIVGDAPISNVPSSSHLPRRQSFAWEANALDYAERLSVEHGWPIEVQRG